MVTWKPIVSQQIGSICKAAAIYGALIWVLMPIACASSIVSAPDVPDAPMSVPSKPLARIAVVGASASAGFLCMYADDPRPVSFDRAIGALLADPGASSITLHATPMFFTQSHAIGPALLDRALAEEPTLLIALDYLFWFAYGDVNAHGGFLAHEHERDALFELGLAQLARFDGPMVVGDIPDMRPAVGLMLARRQVPEPETLDRLNARLRAWASERPHVVVVPLHDMVEQIRSGKGLRLGGHAWSPEQAATFVLPDRLHPSPAGQIASATIVCELLAREVEGIEPADFETDADEAERRLKASD